VLHDREAESVLADELHDGQAAKTCCRVEAFSPIILANYSRQVFPASIPGKYSRQVFRGSVLKERRSKKIFAANAFAAFRA
jgi:hypothetical protein